MIAVKILSILFLGGDTIWTVIPNILFIIGLWGMFKKSGVKSWWALIPCVRIYMLARCVGREPEGRYTCIMDFLTKCLLIARLFVKGEVPLLTLGVIALPFLIVEFIFMLRLCNGIINVYGERKWWIIPWIAVMGITSVLWGFLPRFQPLYKREDVRNNSLRKFSGKSVEAAREGLTINLEEQSVKEFFQKVFLLEDIHLHIEPGRMVLLLGGLGAGRSAFMDAISGYEKATKAEITLEGEDLYTSYGRLRYEIGFVHQEGLIRQRDTVYHLLMDAAKLRLPMDIEPEDLKARVEEVLRIFNLTTVKNVLAEKLSIGQKKRVAIAANYVSNPFLFLLDEPDNGLDAVMTRDIVEKLRAIADQGKIVIVSTLVPDQIIDQFDDVIVLAKDSSMTGRLAYFGTVEGARSFFGKDTMRDIVTSVTGTDEGGEGRADEFIGKYVEVQHG